MSIGYFGPGDEDESDFDESDFDESDDDESDDDESESDDDESDDDESDDDESDDDESDDDGPINELVIIEDIQNMSEKELDVKMAEVEDYLEKTEVEAHLEKMGEQYKRGKAMVEGEMLKAAPKVEKAGRVIWDFVVGEKTINDLIDDLPDDE